MKTKTKSPWYNHIEEWILAICFGLMTAIVGVNVVLRAFNHSLSWADQAARILFVWCTLIGISLGAFTGQHLKVEAIDSVRQTPHAIVCCQCTAAASGGRRSYL